MTTCFGHEFSYFHINTLRNFCEKLFCLLYLAILFAEKNEKIPEDATFSQSIHHKFFSTEGTLSHKMERSVVFPRSFDGCL